MRAHSCFIATLLMAMNMSSCQKGCNGGLITAPATGTPILETIYVPPMSTGGSGRVTSISWLGRVLVQPADSLILRLRAPWPTDLGVLINGQPLQQIRSDAPPPQPDDSGYYTADANPR